jgi:hypothetical protein
VEKFDGSQFATDVRKHTPLVQDQLILFLQMRRKVIHKFSNKTSAGVAGLSSTFVDTDFIV